MDLKKQLYVQIGKRVKSYRKKSGLSQAKFGKDGSEVGAIEKVKFKGQNTSFISPDVMKGMMETIRGNRSQLTEFELVYGNEQEFRSFLRYLFDYVAFNVQSPEPQIHIKKWDERLHYDPKIEDLSRKLINALSFDGEFSYLWEGGISDMYFVAHTDAGPYDLSDNEVNKIINAIDRLFNLVQDKMAKSYRARFESNGNTSMKKLEKRITKWLLEDFSAILDATVEANKNNDIRSVGYTVQSLMDQGMDLKDHGHLQENDGYGPYQPRAGSESYELETSIRELAVLYMKSAKLIAEKQNEVFELSQNSNGILK